MGISNFVVKRRKLFERMVDGTPYIMVMIILAVMPTFTSSYLQGILTKALILAIFALSLNLLVGYTGLISLGHAAYFGVGGYSVGILIIRYGVDSFWFIAAIGILAATFISAVFGIIALRVSGVYFLAVTLALGQLLYSVAVKWRKMTGGTDGIVCTGYPNFKLDWLTFNTTSFYYLVFIIFVVSFLSLHRLVNSTFGYSLKGIRDNEPRMKCLGYNTWLHKYIAFIVSGFFAGLAGVLLGYYSSVVIPEYLSITISALAMLMVIIGGDRVFVGPAVGALVIVLVEYYSSTYLPQRWPLILGGLFVLSVMFLPGGITIYLSKRWRRWRALNGGIES